MSGNVRNTDIKTLKRGSCQSLMNMIVPSIELTNIIYTNLKHIYRNMWNNKKQTVIK